MLPEIRDCGVVFREQDGCISPAIQLQFLVLIFAATTVLGRLCSLSAPSLVTWRCALAALGAALWVCVVKGRRLWLGWEGVGKLMGVGVLIGLHWLCLFGAVKVANVSIALAGLATLSLFTAFTEPWMGRRRVRRFEVALGLLVLLGIVMMAGAERGHLMGLSLALASALLAAVFLVINKHLVVGGRDPMVMVVWEMAAAAVLCLLSVPVLGGRLDSLLIRDPMDVVWLLILSIGCTVFAQAWANRLLGQMSAYKFNLAANFEPVYGMVVAAILFGDYQSLRLTFYLGAFTVVMANFLYPWLARRQPVDS